MTDAVNHDLDIEATKAITSAGRSATLRNWCFGASALIFCAGAAATGMLWATHQGTQPDDIRAVLETMVIKTSVEGKVTMTDGVVTLADGGTVGIEDGATVKLSDGGVVTLRDGGVVNVRGDNRTALPTSMPPARQGDDAIKREVTVFSTIKLNDQESVLTGWNFASATSKVPTQQFCYHNRTLTNGTSARTNLANNGTTLEDNRDKLSYFDSYVAKCVWFKQGDV